MKTTPGLFLFAAFIGSLSACHETFRPMSNDQSTDCRDTTLQANIIGTWHFVSDYESTLSSSSHPTTQGTVTFTADGTIIDPDSLFQVHHVPIRVEQETYKPSTRVLTPGGDFGQVFAVYLYGQGVTQVDAFTAIHYTCHQIELAPAHSTAASIVLTRL